MTVTGLLARQNLPHFKICTEVRPREHAQNIMGNQQSIEIIQHKTESYSALKKRKICVCSSDPGENDTDTDSVSDHTCNEVEENENFTSSLLYQNDGCCKYCSMDLLSMEKIAPLPNNPLCPEVLTECDVCARPFTSRHFFENARAYSSKYESESEWIFWPNECIVESCVYCLAYQTFFGAAGFQKYAARCEQCWDNDDEIHYVSKAINVNDLHPGDMVRAIKRGETQWDIAYVTEIEKNGSVLISFEDASTIKSAVSRHFSEVQKCMV